MKTKLTGMAAMGTAILLAACLPTPLGAAGQGKVAIAVRWPASAQFSLQAIPEGTRRIDISISGAGIPLESALEQSLTPESGKAESDVFLEVPIGPKLVQVKAFDANGKWLAQGDAQVLVAPNQVVEARVVLRPVGPTSAPSSPRPSGEASVVPSPIVPEASATPSASPEAEQKLLVQAFAGNGLGESVDAPNLAGAGFRYPRHLLWDQARQVLWVVDNEGHSLRRVNWHTGNVDTLWSARSTSSPESGKGALAALSAPKTLLATISGLAIGPDGALYFSDSARHGIYRFDPSVGGDALRWAGGAQGFEEGNRLNGAAFDTPMAIAFGARGEAYIADWGNRRIRSISPGGTVTTVAGNGELSRTPPTGEAFRAALGHPGALTITENGLGLYVVEPLEGRILFLSLSTGSISVAAGGRVGTEGEGLNATAASLSLPLAASLDEQGQLLVADGWGLVVGDTNHTGLTSRVLRVRRDGKLERIAGQNNQAFGYSGDGQDARSAAFNNPAGLALVPNLGLLVADAYNHRLRLVAPTKPSESPSPEPMPSPSPSPGASLAPSSNPSGDPTASSQAF